MAPTEQFEWPHDKGDQLDFLQSLRLTKEQRTQTRSNLHKVVRVVHRKTGLDVERVTTCGSVGKYTAATHSQDIDLVVYLRNVHYQDLPHEVSGILDKIQAEMDQQYKGTRDESFYRKYGLRYKIEGLEIDILVGVPTVTPLDFLDHLDDDDLRAYLSPSVSHLNKRIIKSQHFIYHDLVIAAKKWRDSYRWKKGSKPKSYLIEILMLEAFRRLGYCTRKAHAIHTRPSIYYGNTQSALMAQFFQLIASVDLSSQGYDKHNLPDLFVWFGAFYDKSDLPLEQQKPLFMDKDGRRATAIVVDPVNPTNNLWLSALRNPAPLVQRAREASKMFDTNLE